MIEIYRREYGRDKLIVIAENINDIFWCVNEDDLRMFGYEPWDRCDGRLLFNDAAELSWLTFKRECYVAYEDGQLITPDRLVGMYRNRPPRKCKRRQHRPGRAYGSFRRPRVMNEKRQVEAVTADEHVVNVRPNRNLRHLPDDRNDNWARNEKCWKKHNKRRHQYK